MLNEGNILKNRTVPLILWVVAVGLLVTSVYSVYSAWRSGLIQSRTETASRLMAIRTSPLSTETPGLNAWVSWSLLNFQSRSNSSESQNLRRLVHPKKNGPVPEIFHRLSRCMKDGVYSSDSVSKQNLNSSETDRKVSRETEAAGEVELIPAVQDHYLEFRSVGKFLWKEMQFVFSKRKNEKAFQRLSHSMATQLEKIKKLWGENTKISTEDWPTISSFHVARFYIMDQEGNIVSLPIGSQGGRLDRDEVVESEQEEFQKNGLSPRLVSDAFFFRFRYDRPLENQISYSGTYLDLGGLGLVATVSRPIVVGGRRCVLGADIAFDVQWQKYAQRLSPSISTHVSTLPDFRSGEIIWEKILDSIPVDRSDLRTSIGKVADRQRSSYQGNVRKSAYIASVPGGGDAMAVQVDRTTWLVLLLNVQKPSLPWMTMILTTLAFGCLLVHMEWSRRWAEKSRRLAQKELQEKQNILDTMQVPLIVVDPNTDQLVYCNQAAGNIGIQPGQLFGRDVVSNDPRAEEIYRKNQVASGKPRRAYGVPIHLPGKDGYAVVRSVSVTAPIATLSADHRHRLGILFVLDEENDLAILLEDRLKEAQKEERQKLSGLLSHGLELFTRVMARSMSTKYSFDADQKAGQPDLLNWISEHINHRLNVVCWTLDHWGEGSQTSDRREVLLDKSSVENQLKNLQTVFQIAATDRSLREQLHWNNGPASLDSLQEVERRSLLKIQVDWPENVFATERYKGSLAFLLSELLVNAAKHGSPDLGIQAKVNYDPVRRELVFEIVNGIQSELVGQVDSSMKKYGGLQIVNQIADLCQWAPLKVINGEGRFSVVLRVPAVPKSDA